MTQQCQAFGVSPRVGHNGDVHALYFLNPGIVDFGKYQLVSQTEGVIAATVKRPRRQAPEIAHPWQGNVGKPIEELVHAVAPQSYHRPDWHVLAQLEVGNGLSGSRDHRFLSGDLR